MSETQTVEVPGGTLAYSSHGSGAPILFLHAAIADRRMWDRELARFGAGYHAVSFDFRGYGGSVPAKEPYSSIDDTLAVIDALRLDRPLLVGASYGGRVALDTALAHPTRVSGLVLLAPGLSGMTPDMAPEGKEAFEEDDRRSQEVMDAWTKGDRPVAIDRLRALWCSALDGPSLQLFRAMVEENASEVFEDRSARHERRVGAPAAGRLGTVAVPTSVLVGDRDNPSMPFFAQVIVRGIPGARYVPVSGADHLINLSRPDAFEAEMDRFLHRPR